MLCTVTFSQKSSRLSDRSTACDFTVCKYGMVRSALYDAQSGHGADFAVYLTHVY